MTRTALLIAMTVAVAGFTGCSKNDRDEIADTTKEAYQDSKDAVVRGFEDLKSYTYEKRADFQDEMKARQASIEADISDMKADYSESNASASRKAAMQRLKDANADYNEKLSALGTATADTWSATRDRASAAWDKLEAAFREAQASK